MFIVKKKYFLIIENTKDLNLKNTKINKKIIIIYRNKNKSEKTEEIIRFRRYCKTKRFKFYVANDTKLALAVKSDGLYLSSHNKSFKSLNLKRKNFSIIGSAHNIREIEFKIKQGCENILLSKLFKVEYKPNSSYFGLIRFNIFSNFSKRIIPLGGINSSNFNNLKNLKSEGVAILSEIKKNPANSSRLF